MSIPDVGEVNRDILHSVLDEVDFYTGRWVGQEGIPTKIPGVLGEKAAAMVKALWDIRYEMHDMERLLMESRAKETR